MAAKQEAPALDTVIRNGEFQYDLLDRIRSQTSLFGETFRCRERRKGTEHCMRIVPLATLSGRSTRIYTKEALELWKSLQHSHILACLCYWQDSRNLYILTQPALRCLEDLLRSKGAPPPQALFEKWLYQIAAALKYLHHDHDRNRPVLHRNLKPANVMVTDHYTLCLSDFGVSRELEGPDAMSKTIIGTPSVMSPEMISKTSYTAKTDIWSFGITATYIATLRKAIEAQTFQVLFEKTVTGQVACLSGRYCKDASRIVNSMLQVEPGLRPSSRDLVKDLVKTFPHCQEAPHQDSYPDADSSQSRASVSVSEHGRPAAMSSRVTRRSANHSRASCPAVAPQAAATRLCTSSQAAMSSGREASAPTEAGASGPRQTEVNVNSLSLVILTEAMSAKGDTKSRKHHSAKPKTRNRDDGSVGRHRVRTGRSGRGSKELREEDSNAEKKEDALLYTFPGAFMVTRNRNSRYLPRSTTTTASPRPRTLSESTPEPSMEPLSSPGTQLLSVSIEEWPWHLQQWWNIASSLLSRMSLAQLLDALMVMKLVSSEDLKMWLQHNVGDDADNVVDDLRHLYLLDKELSENDIRSVIQTLRQRPARH